MGDGIFVSKHGVGQVRPFVNRDFDVPTPDKPWQVLKIGVKSGATCAKFPRRSSVGRISTLCSSVDNAFYWLRSPGPLIHEDERGLRGEGGDIAPFPAEISR